MANPASIFAASLQPLTLALLVLPQSSILEVASTLAPLRSANRHLGSELYRWRVVSPDGRAKPDPRLDPRVAAAFARIKAHLDTPETTSEIARAVSLSPRRLEQIFTKNLGLGPSAYALNHSLSAARRMITDTRHPLAEEALRCWFSSASAPSRLR